MHAYDIAPHGMHVPNQLFEGCVCNAQDIGVAHWLAFQLAYGVRYCGDTAKRGSTQHAVGEFDIEAVFKHRKETGSILNYPGAKSITNTMETLEMDCDVLIPAALENQITADNAPRIKAKVIGEGANGPVTKGAEEILLKRGVMIVPDLYLNAGGVTVSYFEWGKNLSHMRFGRLQKHLDEMRSQKLVGAIERLTGKEIPEADRRIVSKGPDELDLVNSGLEESMVNAYREIRETHLRLAPNESMRVAAFIIAIQRVSTTYEQLGIFP